MPAAADILLTYYSVASLIAFIFAILVSAFLLSIPRRSKAAFHLAIIFASLGLMGLVYFLSASLYHPLGARQRSFVVVIALIGATHCAQLFFYFPSPAATRFARVLLIVEYVISAAGLFYNEMVLHVSEITYRFDGHAYDFVADTLGQRTARLILLLVVIMVAAGIWRIIREKKQRLIVLLVLVGLITMTVAPGIANLLSRAGKLDRDVYQTMFSLCMVVGGFIVTVVFVNNTMDRTTFMAKIVGTSLVTLLVVLQLQIWGTFRLVEDSYNQSHIIAGGRILSDPSFRTEDFRYAAFIKNQDSGLVITGDIPPLDSARIEMLNALVLEKIKHVQGDGQSAKEEIEYILATSHDQFQPYSVLIRTALVEATPPGAANRALTAVNSVQPTLLSSRSAFEALTDENLVSTLKNLQPSGKLASFEIAAKRLLDKESGEELRCHLLELYSAARLPGSIVFRRDHGEHFAIYMEAFDQGIREVGYSYRTYRDTIHAAGLRFVLMILAVTLVVLVGFRIFFLGNLVNPLSALLSGVRRVNDGDLEVKVDVRIEDEIGFITRSFNNMVASVKAAKLSLLEYADSLEEKVKERTRELTETLGEIQALKTQQDGDYFLTSLLIKPLGANQTGSDTVTISFLTLQKKRFEFRKWKEEIGGDLCSARELDLRGRVYTVFINADAMGKSIQGAGGALVLGAVFQTIVERTRRMEPDKRDFPELWIKNAFLELHTVFETFNGSMLVSMVLGLVDQSSGYLYYINAEHPASVIYRNGKAEFLDPVAHFHKLGTTFYAGAISVHMVQLEAGDIFIAGSDGRDDLLIPDANGEKIMNEDETMFLRVVEAGEGDLDTIRQELVRRGELIDDLSLMRLTYCENREAPREPVASSRADEQYSMALHLIEKNDLTGAISLLETATKTELFPDAIRVLAKTCFDSKRYAEAARYAEHYSTLRPGSTEYIYLASVAHKRNGDHAKSVEFGERVRVRSPGHTRNLINLSEAHLLSGNRTRAEKILKELLKLEPENEKVQSLSSRILSEN